METTKLIDFIPAILILVSVMTIAIIVIFKFGDKLFDKDYKASNILLIVASFLFIAILIVHLFKEQTWTADTLKILVGALIGAGSSKLSEKKSEGSSSVDTGGGSISNSEVAGRDINKNIQNIKEAISNIEGSIIHQNNQIRQIVGDNQSPTKDFIFHFLYYTRSLHKDIEIVVTKWTSEGYYFKDVASDFKGFDGMILIFTRPNNSQESTVQYYRDGTFGRIERRHYDEV